MSRAKKLGASLLASAEDDNNRLRPVTIRLPEALWKGLRVVSEDRGCSMAALVRQVLEYGISDMDNMLLREDQMAEIRTLVMQLMDAVSGVQRELHRIGVNYNQEIKLKQIERKYRNLTDMESRIMAIREKDAVQNDHNTLSKDELDRLMQRYTEATEKAGEVLCRILG